MKTNLKNIKNIAFFSMLSLTTINFTSCGGGGGYEPLEPAGEACDDEDTYKVYGEVSQFIDPDSEQVRQINKSVNIQFLAEVDGQWYTIGNTTTDTNGNFEYSFDNQTYMTYLKDNDLYFNASVTIIDAGGDQAQVTGDASTEAAANNCDFTFAAVILEA